LNTLHNLAFYFGLMRGMRVALEQGRFTEYTSRIISEAAEEDREPE